MYYQAERRQSEKTVHRLGLPEDTVTVKKEASPKVGRRKHGALGSQGSEDTLCGTASVDPCLVCLSKATECIEVVCSYLNCVLCVTIMCPSVSRSGKDKNF